MSGFAPGDVVVCVWETPCLPYGCVDRVTETFGGRSDIDTDFTGQGVVLANHRPSRPLCRGYDARRFRKIDAADDEFTEQMRALRPVRAPLQAGCR